MLCCEDKSVTILTWNILSVIKYVMVFNRLIGRLNAFSFISRPWCQTYQKPVLNQEKLLWCIVCFQSLVRLFQIYVRSGGMWSVVFWIWIGILGLCVDRVLSYSVESFLLYSLEKVINRLISLKLVGELVCFQISEWRLL